MTDIVLGHSYYLRFDPKLFRAMQPYPPLGTLYASSYVRDRGYTVALFDAMLAASETEWDETLARHQPRFAVLFEDNFNYLSKLCLLRMREAALTMMRMAKRRGCTVIVGGADASDHTDLYLAGGADYVLIGEGEETLGELLDVLDGRVDRPTRAIGGLAWAEDGQLHANARRPPIADLDGIPFPAWDLVDIPRYRAAWGRHGEFSLNLVTTRGCPYHCNWCAKPIWGQRYNVRSPENVAAELKMLKERYAPGHIWFMDDIMGLTPGWLERFADLVVTDGLVTPFKCLSRADLLLRGQTVKALKRAGARNVWIGAESGSQKVLDAMEKGIRVEQIASATELLKSVGIQVGFFLQFGYPGETWADIQQTFRTVWRSLPNSVGVSVSYPLPGTKFYDRVVHELGAKRQWDDSEDLAMLYRGPFSTAFYRTLAVALHREFGLRRMLVDVWGRVTRGPGRLRAVASLVLAIVRAGTLPVLWLRLWWLRSRSQAAVPLGLESTS